MTSRKLLRGEGSGARQSRGGRPHARVTRAREVGRAAPVTRMPVPQCRGNKPAALRRPGAGGAVRRFPVVVHPAPPANRCRQERLFNERPSHGRPCRSATSSPGASRRLRWSGREGGACERHRGRQQPSGAKDRAARRLRLCAGIAGRGPGRHVRVTAQPVASVATV
jgi:hypothetical protein